jgi:hypothetical protein
MPEISKQGLSVLLILSFLGLLSLPVSASNILEKQQTFNIRAMPLTESLLVFSEQTGLQIMFSSVDVANLSSPEINGYRTLGSVLKELLSSGGLIYEFIDENTVIVKRTWLLKKPQSAAETKLRSGGRTA